MSVTVASSSSAAHDRTAAPADEESAALAFRAQLAADWFVAFNVLTNIMTIRRVGSRLFDELTAELLRGHQETSFLAGLVKLKLDEDPSDPVRCARYHAFSNAPGGLNMTYGVESLDKAWVFYNLPYLRDRWTGCSSFVYTDYYAANMAGWHANNGVLLGNPGLGFAITHLVSRGDPYDAGYFFDAHRALDPSERLRVAFGELPPADLRIEKPFFDPVDWPPVRLAKVQRRHMVDYASAGLLAVYRRLGPELAAEITELTLRAILFQTAGDVVAELGLEQHSGSSVELIAQLFASTHELAGDRLEQRSGPDGVTVALERHWATSTAEWHGAAMPPELRDALLRGWSAFARHRDAAVTVDVDVSGLIWTFASSSAQPPAVGNDPVATLEAARMGSLSP